MRRDITDIRALDIVPAVLVLALAAILFFVGTSGGSRSGNVAVRTDDGESVYSLSEEKTVEIRSAGHTLILEISGGKASITSSDCPDKVCVHTAAITKDGGTIVCVPARVIIRAEGGDGGEIDWTAP